MKKLHSNPNGSQICSRRNSLTGWRVSCRIAWLMAPHMMFLVLPLRSEMEDVEGF
jgi:hypothetical protein